MTMTSKELQLEGLRVLAQKHNDMLESIYDAAIQITGENCSYGHTVDWLNDTRDTRTPAQLIFACEQDNARYAEPPKTHKQSPGFDLDALQKAAREIVEEYHVWTA